MDEKLEDLLQKLCIDLSNLWDLNSFSDSYWFSNRSQRDQTVGTNEEVLLPVKKRPVRGFPGVNLRVLEDDLRGAVERIRIFDPALR